MSRPWFRRGRPYNKTRLWNNNDKQIQQAHEQIQKHKIYIFWQFFTKTNQNYSYSNIKFVCFLKISWVKCLCLTLISFIKSFGSLFLQILLHHYWSYVITNLNHFSSPSRFQSCLTQRDVTFDLLVKLVIEITHLNHNLLSLLILITFRQKSTLFINIAPSRMIDSLQDVRKDKPKRDSEEKR